MTRKHFETIADILNLYYTGYSDSLTNKERQERKQHVERIAKNMATAFKIINPKFKKDIFLKRCLKD